MKKFLIAFILSVAITSTPISDKNDNIASDKKCHVDVKKKILRCK